MAPNKMLIDATHPEETRVVVLRNGRVEEFDYESAARKLLRGNIYLAKVTRVEPSLQAAFVDYGGNRHGFLAFNEIHPDYYQIPMADRQALIEEEALAEAEEEAAADARAERLARRRQHHSSSSAPEAAGEENSQDDDDHHEDHPADGADDDAGDDHADDDGAPHVIAEATARDDVLVEDVAEPESAGGFEGGEPASDEGEATDDSAADAPAPEAAAEAAPEGAAGADNGDGGGVQVVASATTEPDSVESVGSEDALEELPSRPRRRPRSYKIQEVIKRRQVILVQVVKEERGNKGAALTTYLSLAGRYTVLMPNTARGGGISRKITNPQDRKRLKAIAQELEVPEGMGLIIRTAGASRTKQEIKRDFEYLLRLWESVRDLTLESTAPSLVYEEGNLIKRSIRDLYNKDVEEIVVAGEHAHKDAKDFMRMLMPSHAKNVLVHQDPEPLFTKYGIERQLNAMFNPYVTLKSGGYLVINQTEALVAIDVNSGKSTREFSIEETALNTNLEAADEIARQLKLRDLAGLIVIDFIDMEEKRNNRAVERRLKDALRFDRARIQLGRISHFGLMEMSRQRLRSGVLEGSTSQCPHCQGTGIIRSTESVALAVLRALEDALMAGARTSLVATTTSSVALYILNNKRHFINEIEAREGVFITVQASDKLQGANFLIEKGHAAPVAARRPDRAAVNMDWGFADEGAEADSDEADAETVEAGGDERGEARGDGRGREEGGREGGRRRRRRRGRRGGEGRGDARVDNARRADEGGQTFDDSRGDADADLDEPIEAGASDHISDVDGGDEDSAPREAREQGGSRDRSEEGNGGRRRRRGRRGGRRGRDRARPHEEGAELEGAASDADADDGAPESVSGEPEGSPAEEAAPVRSQPREPRRRSERNGEGRPSRPQRVETGEQPEASEPARAVRAERQTPVRATQREEAPPATAPPAEDNAVLARVRARQAAAAEPKLERVVVSPDETGSEGSAEDAPKRGGWWQRRLGG